MAIECAYCPLTHMALATAGSVTAILQLWVASEDVSPMRYRACAPRRDPRGLPSAAKGLTAIQSEKAPDAFRCPQALGGYHIVFRPPQFGGRVLLVPSVMRRGYAALCSSVGSRSSAVYAKSSRHHGCCRNPEIGSRRIGGMPRSCWSSSSPASALGSLASVALSSEPAQAREEPSVTHPLRQAVWAAGLASVERRALDETLKKPVDRGRSIAGWAPHTASWRGYPHFCLLLVGVRCTPCIISSRPDTLCPA